jgi:hypothetical protein
MYDERENTEQGVSRVYRDKYCNISIIRRMQSTVCQLLLLNQVQNASSSIRSVNNIL